MSWYETTAFESITLCRSLLDNESLRAFDGVLRGNGLAKLCRNDVMKPTQTNRDEASAELEWLKTLLVNVNKRANQFGIPLRKRKYENEAHASSHLSNRPACSQTSRRNVSRPPASEASRLNASASQSSSWRDRLKQRKDKRIAKPSYRERARRDSVPLRKVTTPQKKPGHKPAQKINSSKPAQPEEAWCICRGGSAGLMIACDNSKCPYEWFHAKCVSLQREPTNTWYCPLCRPKFERIQRAQRRKR